jgi:hypothetical protein
MVLLMAGVGLAIGLVCFVCIAVARSAAAVVVLVGTWMATTALRDSIDVSWTFGGTRVTALDVMCLIIAAVGVARIVGDGVRVLTRGLPLVLLGLLIVHVARGAADFGLQTAISGSRSWLYFGAALVYASSVPQVWTSAIWKILIVSGGCLAAVALPYFAVEGVHTATNEILRNGEWIASRPVTAGGALLILQSAVMALALDWPSPQLARALASVEAAVLLLLQHRTVWAAALVVALVGFVAWTRREMMRSPEVVFARTGLVLLGLPLAVAGFVRSGALVSSVQEAVSHHSTFTWRTTSWTELIGAHHSPLQVATGGPSGASWAREIGGQIVDRSAHNGFVDLYLRVGVPGVVVLVLLGLSLWWVRDTLAIRSGLPGTAVALILLTQLVFSAAYSLDLIQGVVGGVLVAGVLEARRTSLQADAVPSVRVGRHRAALP